MSIDKTSYSAKEKAFSRLIKVYENGKFIEKEFLIPSFLLLNFVKVQLLGPK